MLETNWNWRNNRLFCHIFFIGEITIRGACLPPLAYAYAPIEENKKGVRKFSARFLAFSNEISTVQKIVLSSSRGQGNFRGLEASRQRPRTWGFEAKDKDFKMCPRGRPWGQGRPRGLHLCYCSPRLKRIGQTRVVNGPIIWGPNPTRTRKYKPESEN